MSKKAIAIGCILILIIMLIIGLAAGAAFYMYQRDIDQSISNNTTDPQTEDSENNDSNSNGDDEGNNDTNAPIQIVGTEFSGLEAHLTRVYRSDSGLVVNVSLVCPEDYERFECGVLKNAPETLNRYDEETGNSSGSDYDIFESYIVDEDALKKYELLKDTSGKYLATEPIEYPSYIDRGEFKNITMTFTNPPATVQTITINITGLDPFTGVDISE